MGINTTNPFVNHNGQSLVGLFDPVRSDHNIGLKFKPATFEQTLGVAPTGIFWTPQKCNQVAKALGLNHEASSHSNVAVMKDKQVTVYEFDAQSNTFVKSSPREMAHFDAELNTLNYLFEESYLNYQEKLTRETATEEDHDMYLITKKSLEEKLQETTRRSRELELDPSQIMERSEGLLMSLSENEAFRGIVDSMSDHATVVDSIDTFKKLYTFFTEKAGKTASKETKDEFLSDAVFKLSDNLEKHSKEEQSTFKKDPFMEPIDVLNFERLLRTYSEPMSKKKFKEALLEYMFDVNTKEVPERLQRAANFNPSQKQKLAEAQAKKLKAMEKAEPWIIKKGFRNTLILTHEGYKAVKGYFFGRMKTADELISEAIGSRHDWIPNFYDDELLSADDPELEALLSMNGSRERDRARIEATKQLAKRLFENIKSEYEASIGENPSIKSRLINSISNRDPHIAAMLLEAALAHMSKNIYPKLERLARLNDQHPSGLPSTFMPWTDEIVLESYQNAQWLLEGKFTKEDFEKALLTLKDKLDRAFTSGSGAEKALVYDEVKYIISHLPKWSRTIPGGDLGRAETFAYTHPLLKNINETKDKLKQLIKDFEGWRRQNAINDANPPSQNELESRLDAYAWLEDHKKAEYKAALNKHLPRNHVERGEHLYNLYLALEAARSEVQGYRDELRRLQDAAAAAKENKERAENEYQPPGLFARIRGGNPDPREQPRKAYEDAMEALEALPTGEHHYVVARGVAEENLKRLIEGKAPNAEAAEAAARAARAAARAARAAARAAEPASS